MERATLSQEPGLPIGANPSSYMVMSCIWMNSLVPHAHLCMTPSFSETHLRSAPWRSWATVQRSSPYRCNCTFTQLWILTKTCLARGWFASNFLPLSVQATQKFIH